MNQTAALTLSSRHGFPRTFPLDSFSAGDHDPNHTMKSLAYKHAGREWSVGTRWLKEECGKPLTEMFAENGPETRGRR